MSAKNCAHPPQTNGGQRGMPLTVPGNRREQEGLKSKDRIGIPSMLAVALRDDGWYWRDDIVWHKPNPAPESVRDRTTKAHESILMFAKCGHYYYEHETIREPAISGGTEKRSVGSILEMRNRRSVWTVNTEASKDDNHYASYPEKLIEPCILSGTGIGDVILDPFMGSGTTAVVA